MPEQAPACARVARGDRHLGALGLLARAHELGDVLRERLRAKRRLAEDDLADRLVDDLLEARHVRALLLTAQIDEALQAREEQLVANVDDLLDACDADAREADLDTRRARLDVLGDARGAAGDALEPIPCTPLSLARERSTAVRGDRRSAETVVVDRTSTHRLHDSGINPHSAKRTIKRREPG